ncbi:hypothetical protein EZV62_009491 [Acer yangbiense]|uniref:Uncharacterized protein n=1 Tax=Acer yangbiense TaxID=1000413 RepID=A0A5C7HZD9_9ROSI|nr:hypothetical protein EZV62_009491 [Acer yangbiense]
MEVLEAAARKGDVTLLLELIQQNPDLLQDCTVSSRENPIHISSKYGRQDFVREILSRKPCFARELNKDGYSPMHLAAASGHEQVVLELLKADHDLCFVKDRNGWTPLHWATYRARNVIVNLLLSARPESASVLTHKGESFLHLAVKYNQCQDFGLLLQWLQQLNREDLINEPDGEGNTVLHLATYRRQYQRFVVRRLDFNVAYNMVQTLQTLLTSDRNLRIKLQMNIRNAAGLTALDVFYQISSEPDADIGQMLHGARGLRAQDLRASTNIQVRNRIPVFGISAKCLELIYCPVEIRNVLLVLLVPVTIVALQAVSGPFDCSPPQHQDGNYGGFERKYYSIREVLGGYGNASQEFYTMTTITSVFMVSIGLTPLLAWSLPLRAPILFILMTAAIYYCFAMARSLPHFLVIWGMFRISSYWFVWIGALTFSFTAFVEINLLIWLINKIPKKLFS